MRVGDYGNLLHIQCVDDNGVPVSVANATSVQFFMIDPSGNAGVAFAGVVAAGETAPGNLATTAVEAAIPQAQAVDEAGQWSAEAVVVTAGSSQRTLPVSWYVHP